MVLKYCKFIGTLLLLWGAAVCAGLASASEKPVLLSDSGQVELWHYPNVDNGVSRVKLMLAIDRPAPPTIAQSLIEQFYFTLMTEQLKALGHQASGASMSYGISPNGVVFSGHSDTLPALLELVLDEMPKPRFTRDMFDRLMQATESDLRNLRKVPPTRGLTMSLQQFLDADDYSVMERLAALRRVTLEDVLAAPGWLFGEAKLQMLAAGNITEAQAREFAGRIVETLGVTGTERKLQRGMRVVRVDRSESPHDVLLADLEHEDTAVLRYYQGRDVSLGEQAVLGFLGPMLDQSYFNALRTDRQLGGIVQATAHQFERTPGLIFVVQSPTADAAEIEAATDAFLPSFRERLAEMRSADFEPLKQGMLDLLQELPKTRDQKIAAFWRDLRLGYPEFDFVAKTAVAVKSVTLEDVRDAYQAIVFDEPRAVSVIAPGALGGVEGTIENAQAYREGKDVIVRQ